MPSYYAAYNAGKFNGQGPDLWIFRYFREDGTFASCECVEERTAAQHRNALVALGYLPLSHRVARHIDKRGMA